MNVRENEIRKKGLKFNSKEIVLAVKMIEALEKTTEVVCHLMEHEKIESFVLILMMADNIDMFKLLQQEKRDTDVLFEIDKEEQIYAILCQDTKIDGGYRFAERVIYTILKQKGQNVYCSEVEVR
jgi:DNA-binding NarL/FixJ family response regulator